MSHITDVILTLSIMEENDSNDSVSLVDTLNDWFSGIGNGKGVLMRTDTLNKGSIAHQAVIFTGPIKDLDIPRFIETIDSLPYRDREGLALFIKDEHDDRFTDVTPPLPNPH